MSDHLGENSLAYVLGTLNDVERAAAARHLAVCPVCQAEVRQLQLATEALSSWPTEPALPPGLAERMVAHTRPPSRLRRAPRAWLQIAAVLVLMLATGYAGFRLGTQRAQARLPQTGRDSLPQFLLLLEEFQWPITGAGQRAGYADWATAVRRSGRMVSAEKLADEPGWRMFPDGQVGRPQPGQRPVNVSGWFLVRAESYDSAFAWVRRGPHLQYGSVLVRQVE
ncbi:MAG: hypothetical protein ACRENP_04745 [Longimicrobiales bacterium]